MKLTVAIMLLLAGCASGPPESLDACLTRVTGFPRPATPPHVIYSDEWAESAGGMCCTVSGNEAPEGSRAYATYRPFGRVIVLYRGALRANAAHEYAADRFVQSTHNYNPQARERVGYQAEKECGQ